MERAFQLNKMGETSHQKGEFNEALKYFQDALKIVEQIGDLKGSFVLLNNIGLVLRDKGCLLYTSPSPRD